MRTDVKVGIICAFAIVLLVVIYFVTTGSTPPKAKPLAAASQNTPAILRNTDTPADPLLPASPGAGSVALRPRPGPSLPGCESPASGGHVSAGGGRRRQPGRAHEGDDLTGAR